MYENDKIIVLKLGSSVLRDENDLPRAVHEIYRWWRQGTQVLVVASALGNTTDRLVRRAESVCAEPDESMLAALLATGEAASTALLGLALNRAGIPARVLDAVQAGLRTVGGTLDADLIAVDAGRLNRELQKAVVVLPGFIGRGEGGNTTLLGRGGSDLTALFLAHRLGGRCVLLKDVDGIYSSDPATASTRPARFAQLKYETAIQLAGKLVQPKAIRFAATHHIPFNVTSIGSANETLVGSNVDQLAVTRMAAPLRVALLGCGTVGGGVYQALAACPELFTVTGVGTRNVARALDAGVPEQLITNDLDEVIENQCDAVVEVIGGTRPADALVRKALLAGRHVVTANKALLATESDRLASVAADRGLALRYNAAVGGGMPALEAIEQARSRGPLRSFRGVLNGTTNFVLDCVAGGQDLKSAINSAQRAGYAEADCRLDLDGTDAAQKLILVARKAFGVSLKLEAIEREGIEDIDEQWVRGSIAEGKMIRLVASCHNEAGKKKATVKPVELLQTDPLASTSGVENRLLIETETGETIIVSGQGAGRWPTTESVIADLFDIRREAQPGQSTEEIEEREECVA